MRNVSRSEVIAKLISGSRDRKKKHASTYLLSRRVLLFGRRQHFTENTLWAGQYDIFDVLHARWRFVLVALIVILTVGVQAQVKFVFDRVNANVILFVIKWIRPTRQREREREMRITFLLRMRFDKFANAFTGDCPFCYFSDRSVPSFVN